MTILLFILETLEHGCVPMTIIVRPMVFGNELEYRWKRYHNSTITCIKTAYNVPRRTQDACLAAVRDYENKSTRTRLNGTRTNKKRSGRKGS